MIAAALLSWLLVAPAPPVEPVAVWIADATAAPTVVLDVVPPGRLAALDAADATVTVDGAPVTSVADIVPQDVAVALVVDDRAEVAAPALGAAQGAAVELVRNLGDGTLVAIGTPSGVDGAATPDRAANIATLAGLSAGAPAAVSLTDVLAGAAATLVASPLTDRHLVVVLGADADIDEATLGSVLAGARVRVHVVAGEDVEAASLLALVDATGGTAPKTPGLVASMDVVTNAIAQRLRVTATVDGDDPHEVALSLGGEPFTGTFALAPGGAVPTSAAPPTTVGAGAEPNVTTGVPTVPRATEAAPATSPITTVATGNDAGDGGSLLPVVLVLIVLFAAGGVGAWIVLRRRRDELDVAPKVSPEPPAPPPPPPPPTVDEEPATPAPDRVWAVVPPPPPLEVPESPPDLPADVSATIAPPEPEPDPAPPPREPRRTTGRPQRSPRRQRVPEAAVTVVDPSDDEWLEVGPLRLSPARREAWSGTQQLPLTDGELNVLELLMRSQGAGVTADAIAAAAQVSADEDELPDPDQVLAQLRRKMATRGRGPSVRKERVVMYFFGER